MKVALLSFVALGGYVAAFPAVGEALAKSAADDIEARQQTGGFPEPKPGFNPKQQLVSVDGEHRFIPPNFKDGDVRGPCPGLNAMANHGYLPRSGVGSHLDFILGTHKVFGMSQDLSGFLTVLGAVVDGDGLRWSIGGPSKHLPGIPPLIGTPQGISGSHNRYEADVSPGRGDLYKFGDDFKLQMSQFQQLYDMGQARGDAYSLQTLLEFRSKRFDDSVNTNPYFFNGPFTGVLVQPAAFSFIYRFMGNKSEQHPRGHLDGKTLLSFFGVEKDKKTGKLIKKPGHERIPYNWYKRAIGDEYSIPTLNLDTLAAIKQFPKFATIGGNTGKVKTFTGVNPEDIMSGAGNTDNLLKGNNLACFAMQFAVQTAPDAIKCSKVLGDLQGAMSKLNGQLGKAVADLQCPTLGQPNDKQFEQFPGYANLNCQTGTYGS